MDKTNKPRLSPLWAPEPRGDVFSDRLFGEYPRMFGTQEVLIPEESSHEKEVDEG